MDKGIVNKILKQTRFLTTVERVFLAKEIMNSIIKDIGYNEYDTNTHDELIHMTKKEAARLLSVCPSTIDNAARAGKLIRHYVGKSVRFEREQVLALRSKNY